MGRDRTCARRAPTTGASCAPIIRERLLQRSIGSIRVSLSRLCAIVALLAAVAAPARAQSRFFRSLDLDKLRLEGFGVVAGPVSPSTVVSTQSYGVQADYGEIDAARSRRLLRQLLELALSPTKPSTGSSAAGEVARGS